MRTERKKIFKSLFLAFGMIAMVLVLTVAPLPPVHEAHADWWNNWDDFTAAAGGIASDAWDGIAGAAEEIWGAVTGWIGDITVGALAWVANVITLLLIGLFTPFVIVSGAIFEFVLNEFVLRMGIWITGPTAEGVRAAWVILRDMANIGIIAGLVATAVGTIIQSSTWNINKNLARLIIAALLVNFSYFFAGIIVDASNFTTGLIYRQLVQEQWCSSGGSGNFLENAGAAALDCTISARFVKLISFDRFDLSNIIESFGSTTAFANTAVAILFGNIMTIAFQFAIVYVLLSAVAMFIARYIAIIFLLISSPIGIAGAAIPIMQSYAKEWWTAIITQSIFAPLYILFVAISLRILELSNPAIANVGGTGASWVVSMAGTVVSYAVAIGFMIMSLRMAKGLAAKASRFADVYKYADQFIGKPLGGIVFRLPGVGPGWYAEKAKYQWEKKFAPRLGNGTIPLPRWLGLGKKDELGRYAEVPGWLGGRATADLLKAADRNIAKGIEQGREYKFLGGKSFADVKKEKEHRMAEVDDATNRVKRIHEVTKKGGFKDKFTEAHKNLEERRKAGWDLPTDDETKTAEGLGGDRTKIDAFNKDRKGRHWKWDDESKQWRWESRWEFDERIKREKGADGLSYHDHYNNLKDGLRDLSPGAYKEIFHENPEELVHLAGAFTPAQFTEIMGDREIPRAIKRKMRDARYKEQIRLANEHDHAKEGSWKTQRPNENAPRVIKVEEWDKMSEGDKKTAVQNGYIGEFTKAWYDARSHMHETYKRELDQEEMVDLFTSTSGIESGLQENQMFNDAITHGNKMALQQTEKLGAGKKRKIRGLYRKRYKSAIQLDEEADGLFEKEGITSEDDRNAMAGAVGYLGDSDAAFEAKLDQLRKDGVPEARIAEIRRGRELLNKASSNGKDAARKRATADQRSAQWFKSKAPVEVQGEIKQEDIVRRTVARNIDINQLRTLDKDQYFMTELRNQILIHGNASGADEWIAVNPEGQSKYGIPTGEELDDLNAKRAKLGLPPLEPRRTATGATVLVPKGSATPDDDDEEPPPGAGAPKPSGGSGGGGGGSAQAKSSGDASVAFAPGGGAPDNVSGPKPSPRPQAAGTRVPPGTTVTAAVSSGGETPLTSRAVDQAIVSGVGGDGEVEPPAPSMVDLTTKFTGAPPATGSEAVNRIKLVMRSLGGSRTEQTARMAAGIIDDTVDRIPPSELPGLGEPVLEDPDFIRALTSEQFRAILTSDRLSPATKRTIIGAAKGRVSNLKPGVQDFLQSEEGQRIEASVNKP